MTSSGLPTRLPLLSALAATLVLASCSAPPSIRLTNASGQALSIEKCDGRTVTVTPGETGYFTPGQWKCYLKKRVFTIGTAQGGQWRYAMRPGLRVGPDDAKRWDFHQFFYANVQVEADGAIYLGKYEWPEKTSDKWPQAKMVFPHDDQPTGYPLKPTSNP